jgi:hypothetical protein
MKVVAKQEFTITFTGEELLKLKRCLGSGHQYHTNAAYDFEHDEHGDKEHQAQLARQHKADAEECMTLIKALPTPYTP